MHYIPILNYRRAIVIPEAYLKTFQRSMMGLFIKMINTAQKMKLSIINFHYQVFQYPADLVTFTEEFRNGKFHVLCNVKAFVFTLFLKKTSS